MKKKAKKIGAFRVGYGKRRKDYREVIFKQLRGEV